MANKIVVVKIRFIKKTKKTNIIFKAYFPLINGLIYMPYKIRLLSGHISDLHNQNNSKKKEKLRKKKDELIKEITFKTDPNVFTIKEEKDFSNNNSIGIIAFLGIIMGSNQNKHSVAVIMCKNDDFNEYNVAQFFQNPRKIPIKERNKINFDNFENISMDEFIQKNKQYCGKLDAKYLDNIITCTAESPKITRNKNGQEKPTEYKFILKKIKEIEENGHNSDSTIMNAFKRHLDDVFLVKNKQRRCIICGINHPNLLVASHIKARWESKDTKEKIDGHNGLWLCAQHDRAFDRRLFTFETPTGKVLVSKQLKKQKIIDLEYVLPMETVENSKEYLMHHMEKYRDNFD